jgi:hypothetical protein
LTGLRVSTAAGYLAGWAILFAWQPDMTDALSLVLWIGSGLLAGALIGRWWALALSLGWAAVALLGIAFNPCDDSQPGVECDVNWWALIPFYVPITAATLVPGIVARKLAQSRRDGHRAG